ncbi:MAG: hypothetical protein WBW71_14450 [Bacteroidota bacterium]
MPRIAEATLEGVEDGIRIIKKAVGNEEKTFTLIKSLIGVLNRDGQGRVSLEVLYREARRAAVITLFTGNNVNQVAEQLDVTVDTVRHDIRDYYLRISRSLVGRVSDKLKCRKQ